MHRLSPLSVQLNFFHRVTEIEFNARAGITGDGSPLPGTSITTGEPPHVLHPPQVHVSKSKSLKHQALVREQAAASRGSRETTQPRSHIDAPRWTSSIERRGGCCWEDRSEMFGVGIAPQIASSDGCSGRPDAKTQRHLRVRAATRAEQTGRESHSSREVHWKSYRWFPYGSPFSGL